MNDRVERDDASFESPDVALDEACRAAEDLASHAPSFESASRSAGYEFPPDDPDVLLDDARRAVLLRHARVVAQTGDPDTPLTAAHAFRPPPDMTPAQGLGLLAAMALVLLSGFASGALIDTLGVRTSAALLLAIAVGASRGLGSAGAARAPDPGYASRAAEGASPISRDPGLRAISTADRVLLFSALVAAFLFDSMTALMLIPAFVHLAVARLLLASIDDDVSLIEKGARLSHPLAPAFIGPYCRKLTAVWGTAFAASAAMIAILALGGHLEAHRAWTGWQFWALLGAFGAVEFFWRKAWFRYFGKGPFDRLLARVFPPENTGRGRRSQAYLLRMRAELARLAELERKKSSLHSGLTEQ
jgi:hypothetical protein